MKALLALLLLASADALRVPSTSAVVGRRAALAKIATLPVAFSLLSPNAAVADEVCWGADAGTNTFAHQSCALTSLTLLRAGKCKPTAAELEAKASKRNAAQANTSSLKPMTFEELVAQSIQKKEDTLGMSLSEEEKAALRERVRAAYPGTR